MNYTVILIVMGFLILASIQYSLNQMIVLLKEIIVILTQMNNGAK